MCHCSHISGFTSVIAVQSLDSRLCLRQLYTYHIVSNQSDEETWRGQDSDQDKDKDAVSFGSFFFYIACISGFLFLRTPSQHFLKFVQVQIIHSVILHQFFFSTKVRALCLQQKCMYVVIFQQQVGVCRDLRHKCACCDICSTTIVNNKFPLKICRQTWKLVV